MIYFKGSDIYNPEHIGKGDILVGEHCILAIGNEINLSLNIPVSEVNVDGLIAVPGFIDAHVHIAGAGGEGGPSTRTPEMQLSDMINAGVTTVIGCLGTDGITRNPDSVLMKVKALRQEGVSAWMYTGAYQVPTPTFFEDVARDLALIEEIVGVGEIALSDHRSSYPTTNELVKLASHARLGAMLGNKAGILNIHMGDAKNPFGPIYDAVENSELSFKSFFPTHCNRNHHIFEDSKNYGKKGYVDITTSSYKYFPQYEIKPSVAVEELLQAGVPIENITMTSDGFGSLPDFDKQGNLKSMHIGDLQSLYSEWVDIVINGKVLMSDALKLVTSNPAKILNLQKKGRLLPLHDADIVFLDKDFHLVHVVANGQLMMKDGELIKKGTYE